MRRKLFLSCAAVSLLLFAATCVLWVRSYFGTASLWDRDSLNLKSTEPLYWLISNPGELTLCRQAGRNWDIPLRKFDALGVTFGGGRGDDGSMLWNLSVPYWMLALATAVLPLLAGRRMLRARRALRRTAENLCPTCGYDLRATPGRCPECGVVPTATGAST